MLRITLFKYYVIIFGRMATNPKVILRSSLRQAPVTVAVARKPKRPSREPTSSIRAEFAHKHHQACISSWSSISRLAQNRTRSNPSSVSRARHKQYIPEIYESKQHNQQVKNYESVKMAVAALITTKSNAKEAYITARKKSERKLKPKGREKINKG